MLTHWYLCNRAACSAGCAWLPALATQDNTPLLLELLALAAQMQFADLSEQLRNVLFPTVCRSFPYHLRTPGQVRGPPVKAP